jgi:hypothetical protein
MNSPKTVSLACWIAAALIPLFIILVSGIHTSLLYSALSLILLVLLCMSSLPVTLFLFRSLEVAVIFAFSAGFLLHSLLLSVIANHLGIQNWILFVYLIVVILGSAYVIRRKRQITQMAVTWPTKDFLALFLWILATLALVAPPFLRVGQETASGYAYRAYFNADFFRNLGVIGGLMTHGVPPDNPYFAGAVLNYHWLMCVIPAFWSNLLPSYRPDFLFVQFSLFIVTAFSAALFVFFRKTTTRRSSMVILFFLFAFGGSYKALTVFQEILSKDLPWLNFRSYNIDGILRWLWNVPQVDGLYRCLLYAPQHLVVLTTGLMLLVGWNPKNGAVRNLLFAVLLLAGIGFSSLIGLLFAAAFGLILLWAALRTSSVRLSVALCGVAAVAFAALYFFNLKLFSTPSLHLFFGLQPELRQHLGGYLVLNWGASLIIGAAGIFFHSRKTPVRILVPVLLASLSLVLFAHLDLADRSVFSIKFGYVAHLSLLLLSAGFIDWLILSFPRRNKWFLPAFVLLLLPALATTSLDMYNHQDIENERFTTYISRAQFEVFSWMQNNVPPGAVIQNLHLQNEGYTEKYVSEIPPFAARSVFRADPILSQLFQIPESEVARRTELLCAVMNSTATAETWRLVRNIGIDYLFFEGQEASHIRSQLGQPYFQKVKEEGDVALYQVNARRDGSTSESPTEVSEISQEKNRISIRFGTNFYAPELHEGCEHARWMSSDATVILEASNEMAGQIIFTAFALGRHRSKELYLENQLVGRATASPRGSDLVFPVRLKTGKNKLVIRPMESPEHPARYGLGRDPRRLSFKIFRFRFRENSEVE